MRLHWLLKYLHLLPPMQFGFGRNKSSLDNATMLYLSTVDAFDKNQHPVAVFFEMKSASDNVLADVLIMRQTY